jgi:actin-related protein
MTSSCLRSTSFNHTTDVPVSDSLPNGSAIAIRQISLIVALSAASVIPYGTLFAQLDLPPAECMLVIDSGFSFTHVVPMIDGQIVWKAVKR